jgi:hypothetical protein
MSRPTSDAVDRILSSLRERGWAETRVEPGTDLPDWLSAIGTVIPGPDGLLVKTLTPKTREEARPGTLSAVYGTGMVPLHTDTAHWLVPARIVALHVIADPLLRPTILFDAHHDLHRLCSSSLVSRGMWMTRTFPRFFCSVLSHTKDIAMIRFDPCCMEPCDPAAVQVSSCIVAGTLSSSAISFSWQPHSLILLDNWRMLHARSGGDGRDAHCRILERVLLRDLVRR